MKKFMKFTAIFAAAAIFFSCEKDPQTEGGNGGGNNTKPEVEYTEDLTFTLETTEIKKDLVKIKVEHNGVVNVDTWYGFATTETNIATAVENEIKEILQDGKVSGLKKQNSTIVTVRNLEPETEYTFIAVGIKENGEVYGIPASVKFTTKKAEAVFTANPAWTVTYIGEGTIAGSTYQHTITVTSTDQNKYFITGCSKQEYDTYGIKTIAESGLADLKAFLDAYNQENGTDITVDQMLFSGNGVDALSLSAGDWYAIAVGVGNDGEVSGLYAVSDVITIEGAVASDAYASWLGNWTFTGNNGVAFNVTFYENEANASFLMTGWEGLTNIPVYIEWFEEEQIWAIPIQNIGTADFGPDGEGDIWFVGNDGTYFYTEEGFVLCMGGDTDEGRVCISYQYQDEETGDLMPYFDHAHFIAEIGEEWYGISNTDAWPSFPISITPTAEATSCSVQKVNNVQKFTLAPKTFKAYATNYLAR